MYGKKYKNEEKRRKQVLLEHAFFDKMKREDRLKFRALSSGQGPELMEKGIVGNWLNMIIFGYNKGGKSSNRRRTSAGKLFYTIKNV